MLFFVNISESFLEVHLPRPFVLGLASKKGFNLLNRHRMLLLVIVARSWDLVCDFRSLTLRPTARPHRCSCLAQPPDVYLRFVVGRSDRINHSFAEKRPCEKFLSLFLIDSFSLALN
jgi:hypothetical protein